MLQQHQPEDFVIATGEQHTVREFVELAGREIGFDIRWQGEGADEKGYDVNTGRCLVEIDPRYLRAAEVPTLLGDPSKARQRLGWSPKTSFVALVSEMMREDLAAARRDELVKRHGFKHYNHNE
jgi:GDPmannose 4,6-dehydratase